MTEMTVKIKKQAAAKMKKGYPLIEASSVNGELLCEEGTVLRLVDDEGMFIGKGYYGKQNKGVGWILTNRESETIDTTFFENRLQYAFQKRSSFLQSDSTTAFRLFNGEGDGVGGVTIDYYSGYYVCTWYSEGMYTFRSDIYKALESIVSFKGIYEKKRFDLRGQYVEDDDFVMGERGEFPLLVKENDMTFAVYLNDGPMVGVFLDQRDVRLAIRTRYAKGKDVLNTFSYTGAFSVAAALGGAVKTTSVDLAKRSLPKTIEQFRMNDLDHESQDIIVMDVFDYFKYAKRNSKSFDLVILDPPSFARSKKRTFSSAKDYTSLLQEAIAITNKNGVIVASTNNATFGIDKFHTFIAKAFSRERVKYEIVEQYTLPEDFQTTKSFREGNYLKVVFVRKLS
ncbi:class I SAM-dependent rRNA methyltransferase [bacterium LRH843]|nr:class I SAM-dependent rRNA methyltransferase [bacterium LRH843]